MQELDIQLFLNLHAGKCVDFLRFPGNYGDSLIWHGTQSLLAAANITARRVDLKSSAHNPVLFVDGGGNLVDYYSDVREFLIRKARLYTHLVILPHTIFGESQVKVLNDIKGDLTVFCREKVSAAFLAGRLDRAAVYLWHDCAFYNSLPPTAKGQGTLNAFRIDKETIFHSVPAVNNDISYNGYATKPLNEFLQVIAKYEYVHTDRLHVAICATLLGKQVFLYSNSYYKNEAVFSYSLQRFQNILFLGKRCF